MQLTVDGKVYTAEFDRQYSQPGKRNSYACAVHEGPCVREEDKHNCSVITKSIGVSTCSEKDQFVKKTGRKIAFTRAISNLPRELRAQLWIEYLLQENTLCLEKK